MRRTRWAVLGPGNISGFFARSLPISRHGTLYAVGSSSRERAAAFAHTYGASVSGTYEEVLARDDVDAVYVGTVHTTHAELAVAALEAGKAVLCEKPISPDPELTESVLATAARSQRLFVEAYKYRFGPLAQELRALVARGDIGRPERLEAAFGFKASERSGRLFDPTLGGGAILDVGGYPVSLAVGLATGVGMAPATRPVVAAASGVVGSTGVDESAEAEVDFGGFAATVRASIVQALPGDAVLRGSEGTVELLDVWGNRTQGGTTAVVRRRGEEPRRIEVPQVDPFAAEADAVSQALADGRTEIPEMTWGESVTTAHALADWRDLLG